MTPIPPTTVMVHGTAYPVEAGPSPTFPYQVQLPRSTALLLRVRRVYHDHPVFLLVPRGRGTPRPTYYLTPDGQFHELV